MSENFTVEIISPEKSILNTEAKEVVIPSFEGEMGILRDHISLITFLRPGIIIFSKVVLPTPDGPIKIEHFFCFNSANKLWK